MSNIIYPDYNNCILNVITSILKHYNVETNHSSLKVLDEKMKREYKNVVFIVLDGMGEHILKNISPNGFFSQNEISCVTSVYPSTTTAALTTYYSGKSPFETGWIAWSQYFKEYGRAIDMLSHTESYLKEDISSAKMNVFKEIVNYEPIFERIEKASTDVKAYEIVPDYSDRRSRRSIRANNIEEICENITMLCSNEDKNFIMAYCDNPDGLLHKYGCDSIEASDMLKKAENIIENMRKELDDDTIIIISADHGHKDINKVYDLLDYPEIQECLIMPPSLESRTIAFWVKNDKKEKFEQIFNEKFSKEFMLLSREEVLKMNLLGYGEKHNKIDDFIGDYLALSISDSIIRLQTYLADGKPVKKSTHCGLTKEEMEVPVIVIE